MYGTVEIRALSAGIFELLNERFKLKEDLEFRDNHLWDIVPFLCCSDVDLNCLSSYNDSASMEVKVIELVTIDIKSLSDLFNFYSCGNRPDAHNIPYQSTSDGTPTLKGEIALILN